MAEETRCAVAAPTPASPFTTRETVFRLTPAACATSFIVGLRDRRAILVLLLVIPANALAADNVVARMSHS